MISFNQDVNIHHKIKEARNLSSVIWGQVLSYFLNKDSYLFYSYANYAWLLSVKATKLTIVRCACSIIIIGGIQIHLDKKKNNIFQIEKLEANLPELDKKRQNKIISVSICRVALYSLVEYTCMTTLFQWRGFGNNKNIVYNRQILWKYVAKPGKWAIIGMLPRFLRLFRQCCICCFVLHFINNS